MAKFSVKPVTDNPAIVTKIRICSHCGTGVNDKIPQCSQCRVSYYCNKECQDKDMSNHQVVCAINKRERRLTDKLNDYCKGLNSRSKRPLPVGVIGAILMIDDAEEFLNLIEGVETLSECNKPLVYSCQLYSDFIKFALGCRDSILFTSSVARSAMVESIKLSLTNNYISIIVCAPSIKFMCFNQI